MFRFVDRDMLMRYMGGGIGHTCSTHYHPEQLLPLETSETRNLEEEITDILNPPDPQLLLESFQLDRDDELIVEEYESDVDEEGEDEDDEDESINGDEGYISH